VKVLSEGQVKGLVAWPRGKAGDLASSRVVHGYRLSVREELGKVKNGFQSHPLGPLCWSLRKETWGSCRLGQHGFSSLGCIEHGFT
jgi:hypothetical protein